MSPLGHGSLVGTHRTDPGTEPTQSPPPTQTPINSHNSTKGDEAPPACSLPCTRLSSGQETVGPTVLPSQSLLPDMDYFGQMYLV